MTAYTYELYPNDSHKSFYGKAKVRVDTDGTETLLSYGTEIIRKYKDGGLYPLWNDWSATTGRHIKSFCGLNKAAYFKLYKEMFDY